MNYPARSLADYPNLTLCLWAIGKNALHQTAQDLLAGVRQTVATHIGDADERDGDGYWGNCERCGEPWPCPPWTAAEYACVEWIGHDAERRYQHFQLLAPLFDAKGNRKPGAPEPLSCGCFDFEVAEFVLLSMCAKGEDKW